ncbi:switch-associated protein 70 [Patella vulgata]|uniref:switch-associated protein 70 n=1 Tax=Patella vulgata TaxID=6465 RepID=UPI00217F4784|nr:switch-associated protein 70 [Patella vulgata]
MALQEVKKYLWHAFIVLDVQQTGTVQKSRLKVLCNNIGQAYGKEKTEEVLDEIEETSLSFEDFFDIFQQKVLTDVEDLNSENKAKSLNKVENYCWLLCGAKYTKRSDNSACALSSTDIFKLWQIFNCFTETGDDGLVLLPLSIDIEEIRRIIQLLCQTLGLCELGRWKVSDGNDNLINFETFLKCVESAFPEPGNDLTVGIKDVNYDILNDILKKGFLTKYGNRLTTWKERWFILYPNKLMYFASQSRVRVTDEDGDSKGSIDINSGIKVESLPDKSGCKPNRFVIKVPGRTYELCAPDIRSKNEWTAAIQKAIEYSADDISFVKQGWIDRKREREERRKATAEDELKKQQEKELIERQQRELEEHRLRNLQDQELLEKRMQELQSEKLARGEIEAKLKDEEALRLAEQERLRELEEIKNQLERLLEEERQAKRDEEIVRNLQARILEEEFAKRTELEKLKEEQEKLLAQERNQRAGLESERQKQEQLFQDAQKRLMELEQERSDADKQLSEAMEKMKLAEEERFKMEHKLKLRAINNSMGLSRPTFASDPNPFVTHRGRGAFSESDFLKVKSSPDDNGNVFD